MNRRTVRGFLTLFFVGLLAIPLVIGYVSETGRQDSTVDPSVALLRYGFYLEEVADQVGASFVHQGPKLDEKLDHIFMQVASMGAGVSIVDVDRDGWQDIYVTNSGEGSQNAFFRNRGDGLFDDVASAFGLANVNQDETGVSMGSVWGDYDNDGFEDLFLYKWGRPELFRNIGGEKFIRVTDEAGLPDWINANTAIWFDFDRDGALDLFIGGYFPERFDLWNLTTTAVMPESLEYARNGGRNYLLRNLGDGSFEDVTESMGLSGKRWTLAAAAADLRGTGFPDLVLANDFGIEDVYFNMSGTRFENAGSQTGIGFVPKSGMNVSFGDLSNEGRLSIYVTNISEPGMLLQGNNLWVPRRDGSVRFDNLASILGVELGGWGYGAQFGDFNNDGALDLYMVNGFVSDKPDTDYWYDLSSFSTGSSNIIVDAKNWPAMNGRSLSGYQETNVWLNQGWSGFANVASEIGAADRYDGRAVALADLWNRGVLDVIVANQRGPLLIYRNTVEEGRNWIGFELKGNSSNRSAIGAQVTLFRRGDRQLQEVSGGSGFAAQNQRSLHFGLGSDPFVDHVTIRWPSGILQRIDQPDPNLMHQIREPE